ncbi:MAG: hypothetical protein KJ956_14705, partial [Actinobacteria bacterium]|nr:hypothetical protein [Actinomycetota bacterium]
AVSVYLGQNGFGDLGHAKLYLNNGSGTLGSSPAWSSQDEFFSFSLAWMRCHRCSGRRCVDLFETGATQRPVTPESPMNLKVRCPS